VPDIGLLLLTKRDGRPVYVKDVAEVIVGAVEPDRRSWTMTREKDGTLTKRAAVMSYIVGGSPNQIRVEPDPERGPLASASSRRRGAAPVAATAGGTVVRVAPIDDMKLKCVFLGGVRAGNGYFETVCVSHAS
jgi:hypothetical protein